MTGEQDGLKVLRDELSSSLAKPECSNLVKKTSLKP